MNSRFSDLSAPRPRLIAIMTVLLLVLPAFAQVNVLTQHNDNGRTGANLNETILTPSNVNVNQFGMLFKRVLDDQVYGQPLVITNVNIGGGTHNVVYITTVHNSVYAFDADNGTQYWHKTQSDLGFGAPIAASSHFGCTDMTGNINIVGTPVIDAGTNTLYVVSLGPSGTSFAQHLHALDLSTGAEKFGGPVQITAPEFVAVNENQRPALLLANGNVYVGYSSHCDQNTYHGFLIGYNASTLQQIGVFNSSPNTTGKGNSIWHSGSGPAVDASGNIYVTTGNGTWDGVTRFSESVIKLSPSLHMIDWFTVANHATLDSTDEDFNTSGPMLLPGTNFVINGGKQGILYLLDTNNLGHLGDATALQHFQATISGGKGHLHSFVYWNSAVNGPLLYMWPQTDKLRVYKFNGSQFNTTPFMISPTANTGHPGGMLSISANGNTNGILWGAIMASGDAWHSSQPGILHAFDANNINSELWNSLQNSSRDNCNNYSKMAPPTIANGKVYFASFGTSNAGSGQFCVYGLLGSGFSVSASPGSRTVTQGGSTSYTVAVASSGGFTGNVTLSVSGLPGGATGTFNPTSVTGSGSSTLTVTTDSSATPAGTYTLTIHGDSGTLSHTATVTLVVNPVSSLPPGWSDTDIGAPGLAGSASFNTGTFTVNGSGSDIFGTSDHFNYVFQSTTGDQTITARVASQQNTNAWAKAGVMIRETTAANSAYVFVMITPSNGVDMQYRPATGGSAVQLAQQLGHVAPYWVRLVRSGNTFTGFSSADGTTWTQVGTISVTMASGVNAGLAVTAHNNTALNTSTFDNVSITTPIVTPDFTLSASPSTQTITAGGSTSYTVTIGAMNGFSGSVALTVSGQPAGATASLNPTSVSGSGSSTLSVSTSSTTLPGTYTLTVAGTSGSLNHSTTVRLTVTNGCVTAGATWQNTAFPSKNGTFTATFDGMPSASGINSVIALSQGAQTAYTGFATLARFNSSSDIDARNGGSYVGPTTPIPYSGGSTYHFRLVINVPAHTYSIFVTPPAGTELTVGMNFLFRTEQNTVTSLDHFGVYAANGSNTVCNFSVQ